MIFEDVASNTRKTGIIFVIREYGEEMLKQAKEEDLPEVKWNFAAFVDWTENKPLQAAEVDALVNQCDFWDKYGQSKFELLTEQLKTYQRGFSNDEIYNPFM